MSSPQQTANATDTTTKSPTKGIDPSSPTKRVDVAQVQKQIDEKRAKEEAEKAERRRLFELECDELRQKLFGFVEEIIERQDDKAELQTFETFQVETASRRVLGELLEAFHERDQKTDKRLKQTATQSDSAKSKVEQLEKALKRVQQAQLDTEGFNKRLSKMEQRYDILMESLQTKVEGFKELINTNKTQFDTKLDQITHLDTKFQKLDKELLKIRELIYTNRDKQAMEINEEMGRTTKLEIQMNQQIERLGVRIDNNKYWIQKYNEQIQTLDVNMAQMKSMIQAGQERMESELDRKLYTEHFKTSIKALNEFLLVKFRDQEDLKSSIRDTFTYLKLYLPQVVQIQISENFGQLLANCQLDSQIQVFDELKFFNYLQQKLDTLLQGVKIERTRAEKVDDQQLNFKDLNEFMVKQALMRREEKPDVKKAAATQNLDEFMNETLKQHTEDQKLRLTKLKLHSGYYQKTAEVLRKTITIGEIQDIIDRVETRTEQMLNKNKTQAEQLVKQKQLREKQERIRSLIQQKIDLPSKPGDRKLILKRRRSYTATTTDFFGIKDLIKEVEINNRPARNQTRPQKKEQSNHRDNGIIQESVEEEEKNQGASFGVLNTSAMKKYSKSVKNHAGTKLASKPETPPVEDNRGSLLSQNSNLKDDLAKNGLDHPSHHHKQAVSGMHHLNEPYDQQDRMNAARKNSSIMVQDQDGSYSQSNTHIQNTNGGAGGTSGMVYNGNGKMSKSQKRKLVQELKEDILAVLANSIELKVQQEVTSIKNVVRKLELDMSTQKQQSMDLFTQELAASLLRFKEEFIEVQKGIEEEVRHLQKQRARDKSDYDIQFGKCKEKLRVHKKQIEFLSQSQDVIAQLTSMTIESMNMQIYGEEMDLLDRRKVSLMGAKGNKLTVHDMHASRIERSTAEPIHKAEDQSIYQELRKTSLGASQMQQQLTARSSDSNNNDPLYQSTYQQRSEITQATQTKIVKVIQPIKLDQQCLSCQVTGHDTQQVLQLFKVACLSYAPSSVKYRDHKFTRPDFLALRTTLQTKQLEIMKKTLLFKLNALYPKRFFDDLVLEDSLMMPQSQDQSVMADVAFSKKLSFGIGQKDDYNRVGTTMNNTHSTFSEDKGSIMDTRYSARKEDIVGPVKAMQGINFKIGVQKFGERNLSIQSANDPKVVAFGTSRNTKNNSDYKTIQLAGGQIKQVNISGDLQKKLNFDIEEIIKNPNAHVKQHSNQFHNNRARNQSLNLAPIIGNQQHSLNISDYVPAASTTRPKVSTGLGFQDLPRIKKQL